jgi:hypothetical protein
MVATVHHVGMKRKLFNSKRNNFIGNDMFSTVEQLDIQDKSFGS